MSLYILRWNPSVSSYKLSDHRFFMEHLDKGEQPAEFSWSVADWKKVRKDDFFIMQMVGTQTDGIAMIGKFKGKCHEEPSWRNDGTKDHFAGIWILSAFDCTKKNVLPAKRYQKLFPTIEWHEGHSGILLSDDDARKLMDSIEGDLIKKKIWDEDSIARFLLYGGPDKRPSEYELGDGKILLTIKKKYLEEPKEDNFIPLVCCLHDSKVWVPVREDGEKKIYPVLLVDQNERLAFPVYSNPEEAKGHYEEDENYLLHVPFLEIITMLKKIEDCDTIVLDAYTEGFEISEDCCAVIESIKYKDKS